MTHTTINRKICSCLSRTGSYTQSAKDSLVVWKSQLTFQRSYLGVYINPGVKLTIPAGGKWHCTATIDATLHSHDRCTTRLSLQHHNNRQHVLCLLNVVNNRMKLSIKYTYLFIYIRNLSQLQEKP